MLNCARLLTRILPYIFEDSEWKGFFWASLPSQGEDEEESVPLAHSLLHSIYVSRCKHYPFLSEKVLFRFHLLF